MVLDEEGVTLFRGIREGDWAEDRGREGTRSVCIGGVCGRGGGCGIIERRFMRLASVGLIVRAPKPVAWGTVDILFDEEDGVPTSSPADFPGVRKALIDEDLEWSDPPDGVKSCSLGSREGGWSDLALRTLEVSNFKLSSPFTPASGGAIRPEVITGSCRWPSVPFFLAKLGLLREAVLAASNVTVPGPTDFLGGLKDAAFDDGGGTLLCRRPLTPGAGGGPITEDCWFGGREMEF